MTFRRHKTNPYDIGSTEYYRHAFALMRSVKNHATGEGTEDLL